jgi:hypothetical protein
MARKKFIGEVLIKTLKGTYLALIMHDPATGMLYSGVCGQPVTGLTRDEIFTNLQRAADEHDHIHYALCMIVDTRAKEPQVEDYQIGFCTDYPEVPPDGIRQFMPVVGGTLATVDRFPPWWIVRDSTRSIHTALNGHLQELQQARAAARCRQESLESMARANGNALSHIKSQMIQMLPGIVPHEDED